MLKRVLQILYPLIALILVGCFLDEYKSEDGEDLPPTVTLTIESKTFNSGDTIKFKAYGSDDISDIAFYDWQINGKYIDEPSEKLYKVFDTTGDYTVQVRSAVSNDSKSEWADTTFTIVEEGKPIAKLSLDASVVIFKEITFSVENMGSGSIKECKWSIDGKETTTTETELVWSCTDSTKTGSTITVSVYIINDNGVRSETVSKKLEITAPSFPWHKDITASTFWAGEGASSDNNNISNFGSAWHSKWTLDFGLEDHPTKIDRDSDHIPTSKDFTGNQNPYYIALPYNDFSKVIYDGKGDTIYTDKMIGGQYGKKASSQSACYWKVSDMDKSACKNRWVEIRLDGKSCYAQWEDAGPYYYEDTAYVFGNEKPLCMTEAINPPNAGIDLSPSVWLYFGKKLDKWGYTGVVDWKFVKESEVPQGPWKKHITTNQVDWN